MNFVALKMLVADRAKYFSLIFAIAFASFLLANQVSIFIGIMTRPASQIQDVVDADIWVMDPQTLYSNEVYALRDYDLYRVRPSRRTQNGPNERYYDSRESRGKDVNGQQTERRF